MDLRTDYWHRQGFDRQERDLVPLAERLCGIYGMAPTCYLSSIARLDGFRRSSLDRALYEDRSLVRVRAMRGSLYMVPVSLLAVTQAAVGRKLVRAFDRTIGESLPSADRHALADRVERLLRDEHLSAAEIRKRLGLTDRAVAESVKYLVAKMATELRIVRSTVAGGWRSDRFRYALWEDWVGPAVPQIDEAEARIALARRYLTAFGPATVNDFRWWAGLTVTAARAALAALDPLEIETPQGTLLAVEEPGSSVAASGVRLVPVWETALIGHRDRSRIVDPALVPHVYDASGNATSTVLVDGSVAGLWQLDGTDELTIRVAPLRPFPPGAWDAIAAEGETIADALGGAFFGVTRCDPPDLLVTAPRNRFLSPLRDC